MGFDWIMDQRRAELDASALDIIDKAVSIDQGFKVRDEKKRIFMARK